MNLIFLETSDFIDYITSKEDITEYQIIALNPTVMLECQKRSISYNIPEDYFNSIEIFNTSFAFNEKLIQFCKNLDKKIKEIDSRFNNIDLSPFEDFFYVWKLIFDFTRIKNYELNNIFEKEQPKKVLYQDFKIDVYKKNETILSYFESLPIYKQLLLLMEAEYKNIKFEKFYIDEQKNIQKFKNIHLIKPYKDFIKNLKGKIKLILKTTSKLLKLSNKGNRIKVLIATSVPVKIRKTIGRSNIEICEINLEKLNFRWFNCGEWTYYNSVKGSIFKLNIKDFNINLLEIVRPLLLIYLSRIESLIDIYKNLVKILSSNGNFDFFLTKSFASSSYIFAPLVGRIIERKRH